MGSIPVIFLVPFYWRLSPAVSSRVSQHAGLGCPGCVAGRGVLGNGSHRWGCWRSMNKQCCSLESSAWRRALQGWECGFHPTGLCLCSVVNSTLPSATVALDQGQRSKMAPRQALRNTHLGSPLGRHPGWLGECEQDPIPPRTSVFPSEKWEDR